MQLIDWLVGWFLEKWGLSKDGWEVENNLKLKRVLYCLLVQVDKEATKSDEES